MAFQILRSTRSCNSVFERIESPAHPDLFSSSTRVLIHQITSQELPFVLSTFIDIFRFKVDYPRLVCGAHHLLTPPRGLAGLLERIRSPPFLDCSLHRRLSKFPPEILSSATSSILCFVSNLLPLPDCFLHVLLTMCVLLTIRVLLTSCVSHLLRRPKQPSPTATSTSENRGNHTAY